MSGLVKAKKYDWNDSNLALFGSDTEKKVRAAFSAPLPYPSASCVAYTSFSLV